MSIRGSGRAGVLLVVLVGALPVKVWAQDGGLDIPDELSVPRVSCVGSVCEILAKVFFGPAAVDRTADLVVWNTGPEPVSISGIRLVAVGDFSENLLTGDGMPVEVGPLEDRAIPVPLDTLPLVRADKYSGEIRLRVVGEEETHAVRFDLQLRDGPPRVLWVLFWGLLLGRFLVKIKKAGGDGRPKTRDGWFWIGRFISGFRWGDRPNSGKPGIWTRRHFWVRPLAILSGVAWPSTPDRTSEFRNRAVLGILALALAMYSGLKTLYLSDPTFGDTGFLEYAAVFVWAIAADGGQRFLANLKWP